MNNRAHQKVVLLAGIAGLGLMLGLALLAFGQEAILPHGDPRLSGKEEPKAVPDPGKPALRESDRQETGLADPSVNPGQASGMKMVRGQVKQASPKTIVVEDRNGKQTTMFLDAATAGDRDVRPGD
ncbi:MAG TPA: hypothetical protein VH681_11365, partial [Nitrospiraceae bacterium]